MSQIFEPPPVMLIPDSAPFTAEQRSWLNGFLAGWLGIAGDEAAAANPLAQLAGQAGESAGTTEHEDESFPWHDPAIALDERLDLAKEKPLPRRMMAAMAQLDCGACGYVCKTYAEKLAAGEETSLTLCSPGGKETSKALKQLVKESKSEPRPAGSRSRSETATSEATSAWSRQNPYPATVLRTFNLNAAGSEKQTTHVELDLGDSGLTYEAGDSLGVYPTNCEELVESLLTRLAATGDEQIELAGETISFREALTGRLCLSEVTEELLLCLAEAADDEEANHLRGLVDDDGPLSGCDLLDVLRLFASARPAPAAIAAVLSPLRPRLYSISSSLAANPGQVHLTIGRVAWEHNGRVRKGVASTLFADRLAAGQRVRIFVQTSHGFRLPADAASPVIMVGPGTGIAPFRAFLQERAAVAATGRNWLFFGDRNAATDFLYRDELEAMQQAGRLSRLETAFSRDGDRKVYVQDRMRDAAGELWQWLQEGASFYVCGDAKRMALDVDRTLHEIVADQGGYSPAAAKEYVEHLSKTGRYQRDVY